MRVLSGPAAHLEHAEHAERPARPERRLAPGGQVIFRAPLYIFD
jgi:hypothetical protein